VTLFVEWKISDDSARGRIFAPTACALHIAMAVINGIEAIISWNFEHIVKLKTRIMVNGINRLLGYHEIEICSPEEVVEL